MPECARCGRSSDDGATIGHESDIGLDLCMACLDYIAEGYPVDKPTVAERATDGE